MHVSNSSITIFKDCTYKYYLSHILRLTPIKKSWPLIDGEALHSALETYYMPFSFVYEAPPSNLTRKCVEMGVLPRLEGILTQVDKFYDELEGYPNVEYHRYLTMARVAGYLITYQNDKITEYRPELSGQVRMSIINDKDTDLEFRADALVRKNADSKWIIKEYKTSSEWSMVKYIQRLLLDWQPSMYMYGFKALGFDPAGVEYDIIRKPAVKQGSIEPDSTFHMRMVRVMIADAKKGGQEYYKREFITRSEDDINEFEKDLKKVIKDLSNHRTEELWYKNPARCEDYGDGCPYKMLCWESDPVKKQELMEEFYGRTDIRSKGRN